MRRKNTNHLSSKPICEEEHFVTKDIEGCASVVFIDCMNNDSSGKLKVLQLLKNDIFNKEKHHHYSRIVK